MLEFQSKLIILFFGGEFEFIFTITLPSALYKIIVFLRESSFSDSCFVLLAML